LKDCMPPHVGRVSTKVMPIFTELNAFLRHQDHFIHAIEFLATTGIVMDESTRLLDEFGRKQAEHMAAKIGVYQEGWPELSEATEERKAREGYPADSPLLAEGTLKDSFSHTIEETKMTVGSTDEVMIHHEYGTENMPPRPVVFPTAAEFAPQVVEALGDGVFYVMVGVLNRI
jgi:phage gpG-like protein